MIRLLDSDMRGGIRRRQMIVGFAGLSVGSLFATSTIVASGSQKGDDHL
jgi:hypothetical protein